jgi:perosamine synthetase
MRKMLPYSHQSINGDDIQAVVETLKSDYLTTGSKVGEFENKLASYCGAKYAITFSSGTSALHGACYVAGIKQGDEVITTPMTFFATIASIIMCGGTPKLVDVKPDTLNINSNVIPFSITDKTKAIILVDFAGHPADLDEIVKVAKRHNLIVIEDACHALGAEYKGEKVGSISDMTVFSFHPVKSATTGEGGCVVTNNQEYYEKLCMFRNHNIERIDRCHYEISDAGWNYRLTDFQCALGISQLNRLDYFINCRKYIAKRYNEAFADLPLIRPTELDYVNSAWHLYVIRVKNRDKILQQLYENQIGGQIHYIPCHLQPVMKKYGYKLGDFPNAEAYYNECISIPIFPAMKTEDIEYVINIIRRLLC